MFFCRQFAIVATLWHCNISNFTRIAETELIVHEHPAEIMLQVKRTNKTIIIITTIVKRRVLQTPGKLQIIEVTKFLPFM